ncbi:thioredoxin, mitochondrial [Schistocerca cancellata]|uniref:thioredoxin, mitochondrial n=1 Tax=Schistocerca cancellata TaxID=274614 RepID=UPI0021175480|nr:thioredoxin, mitochondrial [Schistocerca cancellata]
MLAILRPTWRPLARAFSRTPASAKALIVKNQEEFLNKVMHSDLPVIVNFHAEWCEPCKILSPRLKELVEPLEDIVLAVVDVENNVDLVHTFEVKAVPAVIAIRNGIVVDKFIGLVDGEMIDKLIAELSRGAKPESDGSDSKQ